MEEFDTVTFCDSLYHEACEVAKSRLGQEPKPHQLQMSDLIRAFSDLRKNNYTSYFAHTAGDWNDGMAITGVYVKNHALGPDLDPDKGYALGCALEAWNHFEDLPIDIKAQVHKTKTLFRETEEHLDRRIQRFFSEMKIRSAHLDDTAKADVTTLISTFQPQLTEMCQKEDLHQVNSLLKQIESSLTRLSTKYPTRPMKTLVIKTHRNIATINDYLLQSKHPKQKNRA